MNEREFSLSLTEGILHSQSAENLAQRLEEGKPFTIAISREVGALGTSVAQELGKHLGWPVYDQALIARIAEEAQRPVFEVRNVDEKYFNWLADSLTSFMSAYHLSAGTYLKKLLVTIRGLGLVGHSVIVGRGASFILPAETTLRVRLIADRKDRVLTVQRMEGMSEREAERYIDATEEDRTTFVRKNFDKDPADPHLYDLILNVSRMSILEAVEQIVHLLNTFTTRKTQIREEALTEV